MTTESGETTMMDTTMAGASRCLSLGQVLGIPPTPPRTESTKDPLVCAGVELVGVALGALGQVERVAAGMGGA